MSDKPKVSVVVPVYNIEKYLDKCIKSILSQTYDNLQILLVDDGSTDKSGDLISFIDGDDWIHSQMYELMVHAINKTDADMAACQFVQEDEESFLKDIEPDDISVDTVTGTEAFIDMSRINSVAWNKLYKVDIFNDIRYPIRRLHEDEYVIHKIFRKCRKIAIIDKALYFYVYRQGSITSKVNMKRVNDAFAAYEERVDFCEKEGWTEVMPTAVGHFCDFCLRTYFKLKTVRYDADEYDMKRLWKAEREMCERYPDMEINEKYRRFAVSPGAYDRWVRGNRIKNRINRLLGKKDRAEKV